MIQHNRRRIMDRRIRALALPSLATLLVEPLLVTADTTMVGHLGTFPLAGLSLASTILTTIVGLCIFLAYATTASTAQLVGSGKRREAARNAIDGLWLAAALGVVLSAILLLLGPAILGLFNAVPETIDEATRYLRSSAPGLPGMLLVLAATGALRGFEDARQPMYAATAGAIINVPLNVALIYPLGLGVAGAGLGTAISQTLMGAWLSWRVTVVARGQGARLLPSGSGVLAALNDAWPLIIRTICLRLAILVQIAAAAHFGTESLAANQITMTMWNFAAYGLDSLATAAQILVATEQGVQRTTGEHDDGVHFVLQRCLRFGLVTGASLGVLLAAASPFIPRLAGAEPGVRSLAALSLVIIACFLPLASVAYILDGVLIGAKDTRRLAVYMIAALATFAPLAGATIWADGSTAIGTHWLFGALWVAYAGAFMAVRAFTMLIRSRRVL